jgi:hypothetical protein
MAGRRDRAPAPSLLRVAALRPEPPGDLGSVDRTGLADGFRLRRPRRGVHPHNEPGPPLSIAGLPGRARGGTTLRAISRSDVDSQNRTSPLINIVPVR